MHRVPQMMTWLGACLAVMFATAKAADTPCSNGPRPDPAEMNKKFVDPKADIQHFVKQWESQSRDIYVKRREIPCRGWPAAGRRRGGHWRRHRTFHAVIRRSG